MIYVLLSSVAFTQLCVYLCLEIMELEAFNQSFVALKLDFGKIRNDPDADLFSQDEMWQRKLFLTFNARTEFYQLEL